MMTNEFEVSLSRPDSTTQKSLIPAMTFTDLPEALSAACARSGWTDLMPVQAHSLPYMLSGKDIMVQSRTGSGKTGAYLLPMLERLHSEEKCLQALVLVPTRELAVQVEHESETIFRDTGLSVLAVYGGVGYERQIAALKAGVSLVVGTPGRILDLLLRRSMRLDNLTELVFDEADRMLSIGFYPDMKEIQRYLPKRDIHATLFSATYPPHVLRLAGEFLNDPELLSLSGAQIHVAEVEHTYCECKTMEKDRALMRLINVENPTGAIVFCNTKSNVHYVTSILQSFGICADELSADLTQNKREAVLDKLRGGKVRILVATDVAARGIDIPTLSHVFLYEPPEDREAYIHRSGRTGRAGAAGTVISLVDVMQKLELTRITQFYKIPLSKIEIPTEDDVAVAVGRRIQARLEACYRGLSPMAKERMLQLIPLVRHLAENEANIPMLAMALDKYVRRDLEDCIATPEPGPAKRRTPKTEAAPRKPMESRKKPSEMSVDIPPHLASFIDAETLDIEDAEVDAPSNDNAPKPHRRRRRRRSGGASAAKG